MIHEDDSLDRSTAVVRRKQVTDNDPDVCVRKLLSQRLQLAVASSRAGETADGVEPPRQQFPNYGAAYKPLASGHKNWRVIWD